jgi:hypothetical protein
MSINLKSVVAVFTAIWAGWILGALPAHAACDGSQAPSSSRYAVKGAEVYDKNNDLTWMRCSMGQRWDEVAGCIGDPKIFNHYDANEDWSDGWRLPTLDELKTLVAKGCKDPAIDEEVFPDTPSEWFHTGTKIGGYCWYVIFSDGRAERDFSCNSGTHVRLVRSGK